MKIEKRGVITCPNCKATLWADTTGGGPLTVKDAKPDQAEQQAPHGERLKATTTSGQGLLRWAAIISLSVVCIVFIAAVAERASHPKTAETKGASFDGAALADPESGTSWICNEIPQCASPIRTDNQPNAPFEIKSSAGQDYLVKLEPSPASYHMLFFVRGGHDVTVRVPLGTYGLKYASGERWYGPDRKDNKFFGLDTQFVQAETSLSFDLEDNGTSGFSVTLYTVPSGNLGVHAISSDQF